MKSKYQYEVFPCNQGSGLFLWSVTNCRTKQIISGGHCNTKRQAQKEAFDSFTRLNENEEENE